MFSEMDVTSSGEIDYSEFLSATLAAQAHTDDEITNAFETLDTDEDGYITHADLATALGGALDEATINVALQSHADADGNLGYEEFKEVVQAGLTLGCATRSSILDGRTSIAVALNQRASVRTSLARNHLEARSRDWRCCPHLASPWALGQTPPLLEPICGPCHCGQALRSLPSTTPRASPSPRV